MRPFLCALWLMACLWTNFLTINFLFNLFNCEVKEQWNMRFTSKAKWCHQNGLSKTCDRFLFWPLSVLFITVIAGGKKSLFSFKNRHLLSITCCISILPSSLKNPLGNWIWKKHFVNKIIGWGSNTGAGF